jgi:divalent metal cation (Fe/Co/Zn/Cd) transporter
MNERRAYIYAWYLALFTVLYNLLEGVISISFGADDESLALFGFGVDSFIEVISGLGIVHMIIRIRRNPGSSRDKFENTALKITGVSFYILTAGLIISAVYNILTGHKPVTTLWGVVISLLSIGIMSLLVYGKRKAGKILNSHAILADAECTRVCIYMSVILLVSSAAFEIFKIPYIDAAGTLGLAYLSFREGRECFEKLLTGRECTCEPEEVIG